jgi:hypothetical protein
MKKIVILGTLVALLVQWVAAIPPQPPTGCTIVPNSQHDHVTVYFCGTPGTCLTPPGDMGYASYTTRDCTMWCLTGTCGFSQLYGNCGSPTNGPMDECCHAGSSSCGVGCGTSECTNYGVM